MSTFQSRVEIVNPPFLEIYGKQVKENILFSATSTLHSEQKEALTKIIDWFSNDDTRDLTSVVVMPTGTGKTGIICCLPYMFGWAVAEGMIAHSLSNPILVIAPGVTILNQLERNINYDPDNEYEPFLIEREVFNRYEAKFCYKTYVVKSSDAVSRLYRTEHKSQVVLCNAQKWRNNNEDVPNYENLDENLFSAVIIDEAHHLPAKQWKKIIDKFSPAKVIFFTATPKRHDGREITSDRELSLIQNYTYVLERKEAIERRLIRDVTFKALHTCSEERVLQAIRKRLEEKNQDFPLPGNDKHVAIVITKNISKAREVEKICKERLDWTNIKLVCSERQTYLKSRKRVIEDIKTSGYDLIIIVAMLLEGFGIDHPPLSIAGILTGIRSRVKFAQFVGRIQRLVRAPVEEDKHITGDIITAEMYEQQDLFDKYEEPTIANKFDDE